MSAIPGLHCGLVEERILWIESIAEWMLEKTSQQTIYGE